MTIRERLGKLLPFRVAGAHCDIPCGIYDPIQAKIAAQTVLKMVMRIHALEAPSKPPSAEEWGTYSNTLARYITVKEEHAQLFKQEVDIIWHDYFRPEHAEQHPGLHELVWQATKLASKNKQSVDLEAAKELVATADRFSEIFWDTKGVKYSDPNDQVRFGA